MAAPAARPYDSVSLNLNKGQRLSSHTPESVAYIKRLVRNATDAAAQGLALERNLLLKLCITEPALARMRTYEEASITSPSRSIGSSRERES